MWIEIASRVLLVLIRIRGVLVPTSHLFSHVTPGAVGFHVRKEADAAPCNSAQHVELFVAFGRTRVSLRWTKRELAGYHLTGAALFAALLGTVFLEFGFRRHDAAPMRLGFARGARAMRSHDPSRQEVSIPGRRHLFQLLPLMTDVVQ